MYCHCCLYKPACKDTKNLRQMQINFAQFHFFNEQNKKITNYLHIWKNCRIFAAVFSDNTS